MATSFTDWTLNGIKNPLQLQGYILDKYQESTDGKYAIVDGNNVTSFLIEGFSSIASKIVQKIDDSVLPAIYPSRAVSISDLYKHLSDYDYLGLFASPASSTIMLIVDKNYIMRNAVEVDGANYRKLIIPQTSRFTIGSYTFGLYYPIEIRVSASTGMFLVMYDNTNSNPLHVLSQNILEYSFRKHDGMELAYIKIPVYQFDTSTTEEPLIAGSGYRRVLTYDNQFYALKCTADVYDKDTDTWTNKELSLALSGRTYDPETPTVVFSVDPKNKQCVLEIPYVYFTEERIRGNIRVDIYTTAGYLNYQIPTSTDELVAIDMLSVPLSTAIQPYVEPFRTMPALGAVPISMTVAGGTNGYSYEDLRRKVVTDAFGDATLQTPSDVDAYFVNEGYVTSLFKDGITDRIFNAHVVLRDTDDAIVAAACIPTRFTTETLEQTNTRTIIKQTTETGNAVYTILPATRYKMDLDSGICIPLTDLELDALNSLDIGAKVTEFNNNVYTLSPFHLQISIKDNYPTTATYDMTDAEIERREYLTSNDSISQQLSLNSTTMTVVPVDAATNEDRVTDRYRFQFNLIRSGLDDFAATIESGEAAGIQNFRVLVGLKKLDKSYAFAEATFKSRNSDVDTFELNVSAIAAFTQVDDDHAVRIKEPFTKSSESGIDVYLTSEVRVILLLRAEIADGKVTQNYLLTDFNSSGIDNVDQYIALAEHSMTVRFGKLVNELDQRISLTYNGYSYKKYDTTELSVLEAPQYTKSASGVPLYHWIDKVSKNEIYSAAEVQAGKDKYGNALSIDQDTMCIELLTSYAAGTLKSFTNLQDETRIVTKYFKHNLAGCYYCDPTTGLPQTSPLPTASEWENTGASQTEALEGRETTVTAHVAPRFNIVDAKFLAGTSPCVGWYELENAGDTSRGGFSTSSDKWYRVFLNQSQETVYCMEAVDALEFVVKNILTDVNGNKSSVHVVEGAVTEDVYDEDTQTTSKQVKRNSDGQISSYIANPFPSDEIVSNGMYLLIEHDNTDRSLYPTKYPNTLEFIDSTSTDQTSRLYIRKNNAWVCLLECKDYAFLKTRLNALHNPTGTASPIYFGYAFFLHRVYPAITSTDTSSTMAQYVSYLTTQDDLPDFTGLTVRVSTTDSAGNTVVDNDGAWNTKIHKWPWEVKTWYRLNPVTRTTNDVMSIYEYDTQMTLEFDVARMAKYTLHAYGAVKLNESGQPEVEDDSQRSIQYTVNMLQLDAKLAETTANKSSRTYPSSLVETMRAHFNNLGAVKNRLYTNTKLYFEPMKSLGYADFYTDGDSTKEYPLDVRMGFKLHVTSDVADDTDMMDSMREAIIDLIDDHMAEGSTNMAQIAKLIKENNDDSVKYVDILGIDDDVTLQTMRCVDKEVRPHLKHELKLLDDGVTIDLDRGLDLEFVVADV